MTSNGTLQDGCDERHDVRFRKRWRCLLRVISGRRGPETPLLVHPDERTSLGSPRWSGWCHKLTFRVELDRAVPLFH